MKNTMRNELHKNIAASVLTFLIIFLFGNLLPAQAQFELPDAAALPNGNGAWVVEQKYKTSIGGGYTPGYVYVLVQSDGTVFHRKFLGLGTPATPWCEVKFTAAEMRSMRDAVAKSKSATWDQNYGPFINGLAPFRAITLTMRDAKAKIVVNETTLWRFYDLPVGLANLANAIDAAGDTAFSACAKPLPGNTEPPVVEKIEKGATIYAVNETGELLWYNHSDFQNGAAVWANDGAGKNVGDDWGANVKIFKGDPRGKDGIVYTVSREGYLTWYKHNGYASGSTDWKDGKNVGTGFVGRQIFAAGDGVIYLIDDRGDVYWYKHLGYQTGAKTWANNGQGIKVGGGAANNSWKNARFVFSGGDGVIYLIDNRGDLFWNKHLGFKNGTVEWSERKKVGNGWQNSTQVLSIGGGIIYAAQNDGTLLWQKHEGFTSGANLWTNGGTAGKIGNDWSFKFVF